MRTLYVLILFICFIGCNNKQKQSFKEKDKQHQAMLDSLQQVEENGEYISRGPDPEMTDEEYEAFANSLQEHLSGNANKIERYAIKRSFIRQINNQFGDVAYEEKELHIFYPNGQIKAKKKKQEYSPFLNTIKYYDENGKILSESHLDRLDNIKIQVNYKELNNIRKSDADSYIYEDHFIFHDYSEKDNQVTDKYNSLGLLVERTITNKNNKELEEYEYNQRGDLSSIQIKKYNGNSLIHQGLKCTYSYDRFDEYGNWIIRSINKIEKKSPNDYIIVEERKIIYHEEPNVYQSTNVTCREIPISNDIRAQVGFGASRGVSDGIYVCESRRYGLCMLNEQGNVINNGAVFQAIGKPSEGLIAVNKLSEWGFIDHNGSFIIEPKYDKAGDFSEGLVAVFMDKYGWGYINKNGNIAISYQFKSADKFSDGLAKVIYNNKFHYINKEGNIVITLNEDYSQCRGFSNGLAAVQRNGNWGYINKQGEEVIPCRYRSGEGRDFSEGLAAVAYEGKWGFIDTNGNTIIPFSYEAVQNFSEGYAAVNKVRYGAEQWNVIDKRGKTQNQHGTYSNFRGFSNGLAAVQNESGSWGFVDTEGQTAIPFKYFGVAEGSFSNGTAVVFQQESDKKLKPILLRK